MFTIVWGGDGYGVRLMATGMWMGTCTAGTVADGDKSLSPCSSYDCR